MKSMPIQSISSKKKPKKKKTGKGLWDHPTNNRLVTGKSNSAWPMQARQGFTGSTGAAQIYKK